MGSMGKPHVLLFLRCVLPVVSALSRGFLRPVGNLQDLQSCMKKGS